MCFRSRRDSCYSQAFKIAKFKAERYLAADDFEKKKKVSRSWLASGSQSYMENNNVRLNFCRWLQEPFCRICKNCSSNSFVRSSNFYTIIVFFLSLLISTSFLCSASVIIKLQPKCRSNEKTP